MTVLVGAGCVAIYAGLRARCGTQLRAAAGDGAAIERDGTTVKTLQARVAELSSSQTARTQEGEVAAIAADCERKAGTEPKPEILAAITAAATAFLGKKARIRSAHLLQRTQRSAGAWAQQGRVIVQTSHNPRSKG